MDRTSLSMTTLLEVSAIGSISEARRGSIVQSDVVVAATAITQHRQLRTCSASLVGPMARHWHPLLVRSDAGSAQRRQLRWWILDKVGREYEWQDGKDGHNNKQAPSEKTRGKELVSVCGIGLVFRL